MENICELNPKLVRAFNQMVGEPFATNYFTDDLDTQHLVNSARQWAKTPITLNLTGETGVGKDVLAQFIHAHREDSQMQAPFVALNCAEFKGGLLVSELFGHEKGAFTDAMKMRKGALELADGGTLFLDEIGEIPLETQVTLLRAIDGKGFKRVGSENVIKPKFRFITATHRNLNEMVQNGDMRPDFFQRVAGVSLHLKPLRDRIDDIIALSQYFVFRTAKRERLPLIDISTRAMNKLTEYPWPGNIRELENKMTSAAYMTKIFGGDRPVITIDHIDFLLDNLSREPLAVSPDIAAQNSSEILDVGRMVREGFTLDQMIEAFERRVVSAARDHYATHGKAATGLGRNRTTYTIMRKRVSGAALLEPQ